MGGEERGGDSGQAANVVRPHNLRANGAAALIAKSLPSTPGFLSGFLPPLPCLEGGGEEERGSVAGRVIMGRYGAYNRPGSGRGSASA